jgi:hypothetical protein
MPIPRGKQHREPARIGVIRPCARATEAHPPEPADHQVQGEQQETLHKQDEQPADVGGDPCLHGGIDVGHVVERHDGHHHEHDRQSDGDKKHRWVNDQAKTFLGQLLASLLHSLPDFLICGNAAAVAKMRT